MKGTTTTALLKAGCILVALFVCMASVHGFFFPAPRTSLSSSSSSSSPSLVVVVHAHASLPLLPARSFGTLKKRRFDNKQNNNGHRGGRPRFQQPATSKQEQKSSSSAVVAKNNNNNNSMFRITRTVPAATVLIAIWTIFICSHYKPNAALACPSTLNAMAGFWFNAQSAFWSYCHIASILVITASLVAERCFLMIQPENMSVDDENKVVDIDLIFGLAGILLVGSGFVRAIHYGQGGDYYIHDMTFWIKMCLAGVWGGMTLFPSIIFYRRKMERDHGHVDLVDSNNDNKINSKNGIHKLLLPLQKQQQVQAPISPALAEKLRKIVNAELSAILFIPLLGSFMRRGVFHESPILVTRPIIGIVSSITLTIASNVFYARKALTWKEPEEESS
jgi:putative membrane protein